ncbi:MAG: choice-of-anchor K domain-containing protein [Nitrospirota bacterium]
MSRHLGWSRLSASLAAGAIVCVAQAANAVPVSVIGGFTSFSGVVGAGGSFVTTINGSVVCPESGCDTTFGDDSFPFTSIPPFTSPISTVEFGNSTLSGFSGTTPVYTPQTPNLLSFAPAAPQDVIAGQEFLLGTFTYANGIWFTDPTFGFSLTTVSSDPALNGQVFSDSLRLTITPNDFVNQTPDQNADFISFLGRPDLGSARAYELADSPTGSNLMTFDFYGRIGSLIPTRFDNAAGGGFLDPGVAIEPTPRASVPEPGTFTLMLSGLVGVLAYRRTICRGALG